MKYISLLIFLLLFARCDNHTVNTKELEQIAAGFNQKGPRMIDSETKIESIEIKANNTILYKYTLVNLLVKNVDTTEFKKALKPGIISIIKVSPEMKKLRDQGTNFEYYYQDKNNQFIYNFKIFPADYK